MEVLLYFKCVIFFKYVLNLYYINLGTIYRLKGGIINISFLDAAGNLIPDSLEVIKDKEEKKSKYCLKIKL